MAYLRFFLPAVLLVLALSVSSSQAEDGTAWTISALSSPTPTATPDVDQPTQLKAQSALPPRTANPRLEWSLSGLLESYASGGLDAAKSYAKSADIQLQEDKVLVTISTEAGLERKVAASAASLGAAPDGELISRVRVLSPLNMLEQLANLPGAKFVAPPVKFHTNGPASQGITSEAVQFVGADKWHEAGFQGQGVKVGVIDVGFTGYLNLLRSELPANVVTRCFTFLCRLFDVQDDPEALDGGNPHGTGVAELVHDMAPHAQLYLANIEDEIDMAEATNWMISQGVQIISFSLGKSVGRFDGDDPTDRIVDGARSNGVLWVGAMGNEGSGHYEGMFKDEDGDGWHEFVSGVELNPIEVPPEVGGVLLSLTWPGWPESHEDYDLYLFSESVGGVLTLLAASGNRQDGTQPPAERIFRGVPPAARYFAAIRKTQADHAVPLKLFSIFNNLKHRTPSKSHIIPAGARGSFSVGATNDGLDTIEDFSAQGPTEDGRIKPDIVAPDRVSTVSFGRVGFPGTSASTPIVAGAAALVLSAHPSFGPQQVQDFLAARAKDLGDTGKDSVYGSGRLSMAAPPNTIPVATPTPLPAVPACIVDSPHPYPDNYDVFWLLTNPDKEAKSTRVHFQRLETETCCDFVNIYSGEGKLNERLRGTYREGVWSDPVPGRVVKVVLKTDESITRWGFCIDQIETPSSIPEPTPTQRPATPTLTPTATPAPAGPSATPTATLPPLTWGSHNVALPIVIKDKK